MTVAVLVALLSSAGMPGAGQDDIETLVRRHAPEVHLHSRETFRPSSALWYMQRVHMRFHRRLRRDDQVLNKGRVTPDTIASQSRHGQSSGGSKASDFFLQIPNDRDEKTTRQGDLTSAVCYAHTIQGRNYLDIQYWFFYPYNGDLTPTGLIGHEGDWERVTVRLMDGKPVFVFYAAHNTEGRWHRAEACMNAEGRPVVYSAINSHASYPKAGKQARYALPDDHTDATGPVWRTWESVEWVDKTNPTWLSYSGHWGEIGTFKSGPLSFTTGPHGPKFKDVWKGETTRPPAINSPAYTPKPSTGRPQ